MNGKGIRICGLCKSYDGRPVVDHLEFEIPEGSLCALLGVNGAGKTTTVRMLCGLCRPDDGDAFLNGNSILHAPHAVKRIIGVSPQENAVAPNLTVRENLELIAALALPNKAERDAAVDEVMERLSIHSVAKTKAKKLSGGYQRRLSIAMALVTKPEILFLDEPTLGLDVLARRELWNLLKGLKGEVTILLTTHYMEEAEALADWVGIMADGRIKAFGTVAQLYDKTGQSNFEDVFLACVQEGRQ